MTWWSSFAITALSGTASLLCSSYPTQVCTAHCQLVNTPGTAQHSTLRPAQVVAHHSGLSHLTSPQCACPVVAHPALSGFCLRSQLTGLCVNTPLISLQIWAVAVHPLSPRWHAPCPAPSKTKQVDGAGPLGGCQMISCRDSHCVSYCVRDCSV